MKWYRYSVFDKNKHVRDISFLNQLNDLIAEKTPPRITLCGDGKILKIESPKKCYEVKRNDKWNFAIFKLRKAETNDTPPSLRVEGDGLLIPDCSYAIELRENALIVSRYLLVVGTFCDLITPESTIKFSSSPPMIWPRGVQVFA